MKKILQTDTDVKVWTTKTFHLSESVTNIGNNLNIICNTDNRAKIFWSDIRQPDGEAFSDYYFNMPKHYQNCTAEFPFSYKEDLPKIWVKPLPKDAKSPLPVDVH